MISKSNEQSGVDAGWPVLFAFSRVPSRATQAECWVLVAIRFALLAFALIVVVPTARADTLNTPTYTIRIKGCEEYIVSCDNVKYVGISKKTEKSITLVGKTIHVIGADGVTPAHFLGYTFKNGKTTNFVSEDGEIRVTRGTRVLVHEKGVWK